MKWILAIVPLIACTLLVTANSGAGFISTGSDTTGRDIRFASNRSVDSANAKHSYTLHDLGALINENRPATFLLGQSKEGRDISAYFIPGSSGKRALVIAGVHGSELSSMEVAMSVLTQLMSGPQPYYSVIVIPSVFPDNALKAINSPEHIGTPTNTGRYSYANAVDPNRQMPTPGRPYGPEKAVDHVGRKIEKENRMLLELIDLFKPQRIANIHAIRNTDYGGIYADPRTDHRGFALGFATDSSLAVQMASYVVDNGGNSEGNNIKRKPTALYYKDPIPAPKGTFQKRNMTGTVLHAKRGSGVSLGTWGATAVVDKTNPAANRAAMRILTIEYPGYKRPVDYTTKAGQLFQQRQVEIFASAITRIFLGECFVEDDDAQEE